MASSLSQTGRQKLNEFFALMRKTYGVDDLTEEFTVTPTLEQRLETRIQESSSFLQQISVQGVEQLAGATVGMSFSGFIGKRTHTKGGHDRKAVDPHSLGEKAYMCHESEYDLMIDWATVDQWAKFKDFYRKWAAGVSQQIALNRIMVGFWGQYESQETSNAGYTAAGGTVHDMGQDFHEGWLQYIIRNAPEKVWGMNPDGTVDPIRVGPGGEYENMDALVFDLRHEVLPRAYRKAPDMVAMLGDKAYKAEVLRLYNANGDTASEKKPLDMYLQQYTFGRTPVADVPYFPEYGMLITPPRNLAYYYQTGSRRRSIEDNKHRKCVEDFQFLREDFVVEDLDQVAMVHPDAIQVPDGAGGWAGVAAADAWAVEIPA